MLIKYNAALYGKGKGWSKPINELTKSEVMVLSKRLLFYSVSGSTQRVPQAEAHCAVVSLI